MRVLLVEDDPALGEVVRRGLVDEGHAVDLATSAVETDLAAHDNDYDVVILDVGLPDGDGLEVCRRLRAAGSQTRILMLTARDSLSDKVAGLDAGADDYLTKPFDMPELAARVRAMLRRPAGGAAAELSAGDLRLDPSAHRVWRGAITVPLTAREFSLLHFLMSRAGEVLSRTEILEHVWDMNFDGSSNLVDAHVANLRRKLSLPGAAPPPIETVRGSGFRVAAS